jgi:hypothetical protein
VKDGEKKQPAASSAAFLTCLQPGSPLLKKQRQVQQYTLYYIYIRRAQWKQSSALFAENVALQWTDRLRLFTAARVVGANDDGEVPTSVAAHQVCSRRKSNALRIFSLLYVATMNGQSIKCVIFTWTEGKICVQIDQNTRRF